MAFAIASAHLLERDPAGAIPALERVVTLEPSSYDGWLRLALARHLTGDREGSRRALGVARGLPGARDGRAEM